MEAMLNRVNAETAEVERAVTDLKAASDEIDKNFMLKLKRGGLPKQGALAGFLLFAVRSLVDSVAAVSGGGDESHLTAALIQGVIAMVCAAIFFFL